MLAEHFASANEVDISLPLDLRGALEFIVLAFDSRDLSVDARVDGDPRLTREFKRYMHCNDSPDRLIALGMEPGTLWDTVSKTRPTQVVTLVSGPLARILRPVRAGEFDIADDLPRRAWKAAGYERSSATGFQGFGSIGWAVGERAARALRRPDLADRARYAMQDSAMTTRARGLVSTVLVREYRRVR